MSMQPPPSPRPSARRAWLGPLLWIVAAFAIGLLVALVLLMRRSDGDGFFRAGDIAPPVASSPERDALPAPMTGNEAASGMDMTRPPPQEPAVVEEPRVVETRPAPPAAAPRPPPAPVAATTPPRPLPDQSPAPRYPSSALRRGEGGEVLVRAEIGPDGVPTSVSIVSGSGSRVLDRAAQEAVRRWRFEPARSNGAPTVGTVRVPITFNPR